MKDSGADQISKKMPNTIFQKNTLSNKNYATKSGGIFNSTCLPSGNLVDGSPLDLHTDAIG